MAASGHSHGADPAERPVNPVIKLYRNDLPGGLDLGTSVAVDTETMGLRPHRDRLCLVQLSAGDGNAHLVQLDGSDWSAPNLKALLANPAVLKIFHFARFDVAALRHYLGIAVDPLYCTRTASKLVRTYTDRHGLKDIALELLDVELDKAVRHTDWSSPDLRPEQVRYAISDVTLLHALKERLDDMLRREERTELAQECFRAIPLMARLDLLQFDLLFEH
jgi:ribonuclease D